MTSRLSLAGLRHVLAGETNAGSRTSAGRADAAALEEPVAQKISFRAYTELSIVRGTFDLRDDRLTDALNHEPLLRLTDVELVPLQQPTVVTRPELELAMDTILIVEATGPRGNERRRFRSSQRGVALKLGPYRVQGFIHTVRGGHPILGLYHRHRMIPMTEVEIAYDVLGRPIVDIYPAAIINREAITNIRIAGDESLA